jgi:hypothetical protein
MKVLNLRCTNGHGFEGWFASDDDYADQNGRGLVECPLCADRAITRLPSAPRLNLSGAKEAPAPAPAPAEPPTAADMQAAWLQAARRIIANTEDVGSDFAEEARRIHYGESPHRGIRGKASVEERAALAEEGIEAFTLPLPAGLTGPAH